MWRHGLVLTTRTTLLLPGVAAALLLVWLHHPLLPPLLFSTGKQESHPNKKMHANLVAKQESAEYYNRFKAAFKEGTIAVAAKQGKKTKSGESVPSIATRLNRKYGLLYQKGKRKLTRTTLHRAVQNGSIGVSPCKRGRASIKNPRLLAH